MSVPANIIRPLREDELTALKALAAEDAHAVLWPTHVVEREGALVGYLSVMATPVVQVWMDSRSNSARDSLATLRQLDDALRMQGVPEYLMPCAENSPYFSFMPKLGFEKLGVTTWFTRKLS